MKLKTAGTDCRAGLLLGYLKPCATRHQELDADTLLRAAEEQRAERLIDAGDGLEQERQK